MRIKLLKTFTDGKIYVLAAIFLVIAFSGCIGKYAEKKEVIPEVIPSEWNNISEATDTNISEETKKEEQQLQPAAESQVHTLELPQPHEYLVIINNSSFIDSLQLEKKIHELVNKERLKLNLSSMEWNSHLAYIARGHSKDMAEKSYFEHNDTEGRNFRYRYEQGGFSCSILVETLNNVQKISLGAENLFFTHIEKAQWFEERSDGTKRYLRSDYNTEDEIAEMTVKGWMNSTAHREQIVQPFWKTEGIGVVIAADNNTVYVTENFC